MNFLPIAASDLDMIIGIIAVIGWIVAQVIGKMKGGDKTAPPPGESNSPNADPQDELRKFFEEMEKTLKPQPEPKPVVVPPPPLRRVNAPRPEPVVAPARVRVAEPAIAWEAPVNRAEVAAGMLMKVTERLATQSAPRTSTHPDLLPEGLRDPKALRKMIVTMEVLGKPVALRQT